MMCKRAWIKRMKERKYGKRKNVAVGYDGKKQEERKKKN